MKGELSEKRDRQELERARKGEGVMRGQYESNTYRDENITKPIIMYN